MRTRTKVLAGAGIAAAVVATAAVVWGPGLYAERAELAAAPVPTLVDAAPPADQDAPLDGVWTVAEDSFAGYRVNEVLRGQDVVVTGRTEDVTGEVTVDDGTLTGAVVVVDVAGIATDQGSRDAYFRGSVMDVDTFPTATFELTAPVALGPEPVEASLAGELQLRDVTSAVVVDAEVAVTDAGVQVVGSIPVTFADFGIEAPSLGFVRVEESGSIEFSLRLQQEG